MKGLIFFIAAKLRQAKRSQVIIVCFLLLMVLNACAATVNIAMQKNIAEITHNTFAMQDSVFKIDFRTGKREENYAGDGKADKLTPFGVLTAHKLQTQLKEKKVSFRLLVDEKEYKGEFEINPFDNSFVFDTGELCSFNAQVSVTLYFDGKERDYTLKNVFTSDDATADEVLKTAFKSLSPQVKKISTLGKMRGEIYIRIVFSTTNPAAKPMWFVSILSETGETYAVVIDPKTREVLAKKT